MTKVTGIAIVSCSIFARGADAPSNGTVVSEPIVVPRAEQYDITSKINGLKYRIMVSKPRNADPGKRYPVFYILDGNWYFLPDRGKQSVPTESASQARQRSTGSRCLESEIF